MPAVQKTFADLNVAFLEADWTNKDSVIFEELKRHGAGGVPLYLVYPASGGEPRKFDGLLSRRADPAGRARGGRIDLTGSQDR